MMERSFAHGIVQSLPNGTTPEKGFDQFSVGFESLIQGFTNNHLEYMKDRGHILFINGSPGSGKTHLFRLLKKAAFDSQVLVSSVELHAKETPFSKFEKVFSAIIRNMQTPAMYTENAFAEAEPFRRVLDEALFFLADSDLAEETSVEHYNRAYEKLMSDRLIDIDFRKMVAGYWETFVPHRTHATVREEVRGEALQWFSGEGTQQNFRTKFNVNKMITTETARPMLRSLANFVDLAGYKGLMILFDEGVQAYQTMEKKELRHAYNTLLHLVTEMENSTRLILVYATTPEFYTNRKYGVGTHAPLASRLGKPRAKKPKARETLWDLDAVNNDVQPYKKAALKIKDIYVTAEGDELEDLKLPSQDEIEAFVEELFKQPSPIAGVRFWRIFIPALIRYFDDYRDGDVQSTDDYFEDAMELLLEEN